MAVTLSTSYQYLFRSTLGGGSDGAYSSRVLVNPVGNDLNGIRITYGSGGTRVIEFLADGSQLPVVSIDDRTGGLISSVEVKAASATGTCYGNSFSAP